jgi:hypothetical protein
MKCVLARLCLSGEYIMYNYIPQKPIDGSENIYARAKKID